jgi:hypothetical protein
MQPTNRKHSSDNDQTPQQWQTLLASSEQFAVIFMTILEKTPSFVSNKFNCYFGHKGKNET